MKKLLYLFTAMSIIAFGCKKEDEEAAPAASTDHTHTEVLSLDQNLVGYWKDADNSYTYAYLTLAADGQFYFYDDDGDIDGYGTWHTVGSVLHFSTYGSSATLDQMFKYDLDGNDLTLDYKVNNSWVEWREYER